MRAALVIDTAGPCVGVAAMSLVHGGFFESARIVAGADGWLTPAIARALSHLGTEAFELGVVVGPGAFTGVRVGMAHALGLAVARGIGVVPLSSLAVRACAAPGHARVLAVLDGKKGRVYAQHFDTRSAIPLALDAPGDVPPSTLCDGGPAIGEGALAYAEVLGKAGYSVISDAGRLDLLAALPMLWATGSSAPDQIRPVYLRDPDATPPPNVGA